MPDRIKRQSIFTLPSGIPFADTLAASLLERTQDNPTELTKIQILLPTRRGCRNLRESFLRLSAGKPLMLPHMYPVGDVDEDHLNLMINGIGGPGSLAQSALDLPPAMSPIHRQLLLTRLILALPDFSSSGDQAVALAASLGRFMDQIYTENLNLSDLPHLVSNEELASHWQITVDFLKILSETWPHILAEHNMIDAADRRNRLILKLADYWEQNPPDSPVIAAGSTGSIPSTARLLSVIGDLPQGEIILPGLDTDMNDESWAAIDDTHPQATLKHLCEVLNIDRRDIALFKHSDDADFYKRSNEPIGILNKKLETRRHLLSEVMRPAQTSSQWHAIQADDETQHQMAASLDTMRLHECDTPQEEAMVIALHMRETLEHPTKRAILITPDRHLAKRVAMLCQRWGIALDDSAGQSLLETPLGHFMALCGDLCTHQLSPGLVAAMIKHKNAAFSSVHNNSISLLERLVLRGTVTQKGLDGLYNRLQNQYDKLEQHTQDGTEDRTPSRRSASTEDLDQVKALLDSLTQCIKPFFDLCDGQLHGFSALLDAHIEIIENVSGMGADNDSQAEPLSDTLEKALENELENAAPSQVPFSIWAGEEGESAANFFAELRQYAHTLPKMTAEDYMMVWRQLIKSVSIRPAYGTHPRLAILGQLEARLIDADLIILGGLNEKTWPPEPATDPWMSRPMRKTYGLPSPERSVGLSAHDFMQAACHPNIVMTRARRNDGAPTTPARWIQRLETVLSAYGLSMDTIKDSTHIHWARTLDHSKDDPKPVTRPAPKPDTAHRPDHLYVTALESWMRDPYALYARYILKLRKLDDLEEELTAADRGTLIHEALENFISRYPATLPDDAEKQFLAIGREILEREVKDPNLWNFWWPRFERFAKWFVPFEQNWRSFAAPDQTEAKGHVTLTLPSGNHFKLSAKADRIDRFRDNQSLAIVDYKSGTIPSTKDIVAGYAPQMTATGLIANQHGFEKPDKTELENRTEHSAVGYLGFWSISGKTDEPGKEKLVAEQSEIQDLIDQAKDGIVNLITVFEDPDTPYYSLPRLDKAPPADWQDYAHLARVQEWAALDEEEAAA